MYIYHFTVVENIITVLILSLALYILVNDLCTYTLYGILVSLLTQRNI